MQYLADYANSLRRDHVARWENNADNLETENQAKGRVNTLAEIITMEFGIIAEYYEGLDGEDENESQTAEADNR